MTVLGDIGQMREVAEGTHDRDHLVDREILQQSIKGLAGGGIALEPVGHRQLSDPLDQVKGILTFLLPDHITKQATQEANIGDKRRIFVVGG